MKIKVLEKVGKNKIGRICTNNVSLEPHEYKTVLLLAEYGFDIDFIKPSNTPGVKNADILMLGTVWEMKAPISFNKNTLKLRLKKASKQAGHVIFDLRNIAGNSVDIEKMSWNFFPTTLVCAGCSLSELMGRLLIL